jgi:hypothetical protein
VDAMPKSFTIGGVKVRIPEPGEFLGTEAMRRIMIEVSLGRLPEREDTPAEREFREEVSLQKQMLRGSGAYFDIPFD